jgi:septum formation protein
MSSLILASASPRRQRLLQQLGLTFTVIAAGIEEKRRSGELPHIYVRRMAQEKAQHVAQQFPTALVLGADTIVTLDQDVLGKPRDVAHARQMLQRLSGRAHTIITGLALVQHSQGLQRLDAVRTQVVFRTLTESDINAYLATDEPYDKAGAYAIQGRGGAFVATLAGCYTNAVGLPLQRTAALLRAAGLSIPTPPAHNAKIAW